MNQLMSEPNKNINYSKNKVKMTQCLFESIFYK